MSAYAALIQDLAFFLVLFGLSAVIAKKRGRNMFLWGILGCLIVPIFILIFLPKKNQTEAADK